MSDAMLERFAGMEAAMLSGYTGVGVARELTDPMVSPYRVAVYGAARLVDGPPETAVTNGPDGGVILGFGSDVVVTPGVDGFPGITGGV